MIHKTVRYKVKEDKIDEVLTAIREFVSAIQKHEPATVSYDAFRVINSRSFLHMMTFETKEAEEFHRHTPHVKRFVEVLYPNCEEQPVFSDCEMVASSSKL